MVWNYQNADCSLKNKFIVSFMIIFYTFSFPIYTCRPHLSLGQIEQSESSWILILLRRCYLAVLASIDVFILFLATCQCTFSLLYIGWNDVTESMVTKRLPFCGYNLAYYVELIGEDLTFYSNKIKLISLRKCSRDHWPTNKAYLSAVTVADFSRSFYLQGGGKNRLA